MTYNYSSDYQRGAQAIKASIIQEAKSELQQNISILLTAVKSDLDFCRAKQKTDYKEMGTCDSTMVVQLVKNRILATNPIREEIGKISGLFEYKQDAGHLVDDLENRLIPLQSQDNVNKGQIFTSTELSDIISQEEKFIGSIAGPTSKDNVAGKLVYVKYFQPLSWIITAELNLGKIGADIVHQSEKLRRQLYLQSLKSTVPVFLFLVFAFGVGVFFYIRAARAVDLQDEMVAESEGEVCKLQTRLYKSEKAKNTAIAKEDLLEEILTAADNIAIIILVQENNALRIQDVSSGVETLLGYHRQDLIGRSAVRLCSEGKDELMQIYREMQLTKASISGDLELTKINGNILQTKSSVHLHLDENNGASGIIIVAVDVSKLEETRQILDDTQASLVEAHKMEAIGTLTGGIAHDFNNVLSSIVGYAELLKDQLAPDSMARQDLEQILRSTTRASELVKQIVAFSRKKDRENTFFEPGLIVKETLKMLRSTLPATIAIDSNISIDGATIFANTNRFHQLFMNLCTNAYQAMEHSGGVLGVSLRATDKIEHIPEEFQLESGRYIEMVVTDTGVGIAPQLRGRVFEPLFSTKGLNGRAGMGLCNAYHMVKMTGGAIWFEDRKTGGTKFFVVLPVNTEKTTNQHSATHEMAEPMGTGNLLLVEDEPDLVEMAKKILESLGYQVTSCVNGEEALQLFCEYPQKFDLIITDQTMPGMTGAELATEVKRTGSTVPIILCTGYSSRISEENWARYGVDAFIMKPFRRSDIALLIKDLLVEEESRKQKSLKVG